MILDGKWLIIYITVYIPCDSHSTGGLIKGRTLTALLTIRYLESRWFGTRWYLGPKLWVITIKLKFLVTEIQNFGLHIAY